MTYLSVDDQGHWWWQKGEPFDAPNFVVAIYVLPPEAAELCRQWRNTPSHQDGLISGVLADWLEEHQDTLEAIRPIPEFLSAFIQKMRRRFDHPYHNGSRL